MPSTEYFGNTLVNLGPLTTTFTAAASCTPDPLDYYVEDPILTFLRYRPGCDIPQPKEGCGPSVSERVALFSSYYKGDLAEDHYGFIEYYSPASICPEGWTTAGTAASASSGAEVTATGVLDVGDWPPDEARDLDAAALDLARQANRWLTPGETIVWCCPEDYKADNQGACYSTVGRYDPENREQEALSTIYECELPSTYTGVDLATVTSFDGTTWKPPLLSYTDYEPLTGTPVVFETVASETYTAVVITPAMVLVSGGDGDSGGDDGDDSGGGGGGGGDDGNENNQDQGGDDEERENNDEDDAAMALRPKGVVSMSATVIALMACAGVFTLW